MTYGGTKTAKYEGVVFNAPTYAKNKKSYYSFHSIDGDVVTFKDCTFNGDGKFINVYTHYEEDDVTKTINFDSCTVNSTGNNKQPLNIKNGDSTRDTNRTVNWTINISGKNTFTSETTVENQPVNATTCSRWFSVQKDSSNPERDKLVTVSIDGTPVWKDGEMVSHAIDTTNDKYTDGYKDNAFTTDEGAWITNPDGTKTRTVTKTCNYCGYQEKTTQNAEADPIDWDVSRSKTATKLDKKTWTSDVTLSLPSAEENLASDVVFVLDGSSSANTDVVNKSLELLESLKDSASDSGAAVNVCVVKFKRQAYKSDWFDLSKDFDAIQAAMETKYSGGTNIHAGLLAGQEALEEHTNVAAGRKYLILVSDGSTYLYSKDGNWASDTPFTRTYYTKENYNHFTGGYWDNGEYEPNNYPDVNVPRPKTTSDVATWQAYLKDVEARNAESHGDDYDYHCDYDLNFNQGKPSDDFKSQPRVQRSANNRDMAFYYADQAWQEIKNAGYNAYSIATKDGMAGAGNADDSHCFMNYLNEGKSLDFNDIQNDILYAVSAGSTVTDTIGEKFTLDSVNSFTLKVGETKITGTADGNTVNFGNQKDDGKYPYTVTYTPDTKTFVWTINENVSNFAPVQLTYTVKLTKPETAPGTYGVEDLTGKGLTEEEAANALYTNASAVLNAKNSAGAPIKAQEFPKPSVSYTVHSFVPATTYYYFAVEKVDAQDDHALSGARFGLYLDGKQIAAATSDRSGLVLFCVSESDYRKISANSSLYYQELTAPEGYLVNGDAVSIGKDNLTTNRAVAEKNAEMVRNYRNTVPAMLNGSDHFAYVVGYEDGCVRPNGLISARKHPPSSSAC